MLNTSDILETINMIRQENLDIRTITMGISLLDCVSEDADRLCQKIYDKITRTARRLVPVGRKSKSSTNTDCKQAGIGDSISLVGGGISRRGVCGSHIRSTAPPEALGINLSADSRRWYIRDLQQAPKT